MNKERLYQVIVAPHMSEKASILSEGSNQVVFRVLLDASKAEVKSAVELLFDAKVNNVRLLRMKGKVKRNRFGRIVKSDWKKAYVRLDQGQEIDFAAMV
ncbi:MAG: 50S ribosomal protein L23 [Bdellovibrionales bacterium]|nr:50S ribosomal protein L23 [Bdellovibrionales bacterium]